MKIKSMTASFGKLQNAHIELGPGLNLIEAPNEAGKSTWCAFLRAMLYGIPTRERDTKGTIAEKNRYQPWSGGAMEGAVELTWGGRDIILRRGPKGNTPFGSFSAVDSATGESIPGLTGENCGEVLLGVSREVYERTAFVGQGGAAIGESSELERRIAALVSSGEEDVSYTQVEGRLREWLRRRKFNKSGLIPKLENEISVLTDTLTHQERSRNQAGEAQTELKTLGDKRTELSEALSVWRSQAEQEKREKYDAAKAALDAAKAEFEALETESARLPDAEALRSAQGDLAYYNTLEANRKLAESQIDAAREAADEAEEDAQDPLFPDMSPDEAWQQATRDRDRAAAKQPKGPLFYAAIGLFAAAVLWFVFLIIWMVLGREIQLWMYWVLVGTGVFVIMLNSVNATNTKKWNRDAADILERYEAEFPDDILQRANAYREGWVCAQEAARKAEAVERSAKDLAAQKEALMKRLLELVKPFAPTVTDYFGVSAAISKGLALREKLATAKVRLEGARELEKSLPKPEGPLTAPVDGKCPGGAEGISPEQLSAQLGAVEGEITRLRSALAMAQGELNTLGDPLLFEARRDEMRENLARREEEYAAISLALTGLQEANGELQARFSPALNEAAGAILLALTGGKYGKLTLDREFQAQAQEQDSPLPRRAITLSQGTVEQVYLAVRLAVCKLALPGDDSAPIVLDDALDAFDDARMALALDHLSKLGAERQILLFSCHSRERTYLENDGSANILHLPGT